MISVLLMVVGIIIMIVGFLLVFLGSLRSEERHVEGGGVIVIGPLPIVIGTNQRISKLLIILAIILTTLAIALFLLTSKIAPFMVH
uniref:DUF131 domain-containing protein n=1 Tax=Ignisphaera aggregans TaxID=334771 RepID=A0A7C4NQI8_9CREN